MTRDKHPPCVNIQPATTALKSSKTLNQTLVSAKQRLRSAPVFMPQTEICTSSQQNRFEHPIRGDGRLYLSCLEEDLSLLLLLSLFLQLVQLLKELELSPNVAVLLVAVILLQNQQR